MKDDSLSDTNYYNDETRYSITIKGSCGIVHPRFKDWQTCPNCARIDLLNCCGVSQDEQPDSVGKQDATMLEAEKDLDRLYYERETWNDAIEAAANMLATSYPDHACTNAYCAAIRSMKK